jgi:hypothetical protein
VSPAFVGSEVKDFNVGDHVVGLFLSLSLSLFLLFSSYSSVFSSFFSRSSAWWLCRIHGSANDSFGSETRNRFVWIRGCVVTVRIDGLYSNTLSGKERTEREK